MISRLHSYARLITLVAFGFCAQIESASAQIVPCYPYPNGFFTPDGTPCVPIASGPAYGGGGPVYGGGGPAYGGGGPAYGGGGPAYGGGGPAYGGGGPAYGGGGPVSPGLAGSPQARMPPLAVQERARRTPFPGLYPR